MATDESKNRKRRGLIVTTTVHAIVLVLFCLFGFEIIDPKPGGMEIEWAVEGIENAGGETLDESSAEEISKETNITKASASASNPTPENELISDESSEIFEKSTPVKVKKEKKITEVKEVKKESEAKEETEAEKGPSDAMKALGALTAQKRGEPKEGDGKGEGEEKGTQGIKDGQGTSTTGNGIGNGRWVVQGRVPTKVDKKVNNCNATGKIKVYIKINEAGKVYSAVARGGTSQNKCLINVALEQAKAIKYAPGNSKNEGVVTIDLSL